MAKWSWRLFVAAEDDVYLALLDKPDEIESDLNDKELHDFVSTTCLNPICFLLSSLRSKLRYFNMKFWTYWFRQTG